MDAGLARLELLPEHLCQFVPAQLVPLVVRIDCPVVPRSHSLRALHLKRPALAASRPSGPRQPGSGLEEPLLEREPEHEERLGILSLGDIILIILERDLLPVLQVLRPLHLVVEPARIRQHLLFIRQLRVLVDLGVEVDEEVLDQRAYLHELEQS